MTPPRFTRWLLSIALPSGVRGATVLGDLTEELNARAVQTSPARARWWYRRAAADLIVRHAFQRPRNLPREPPARKAPFMDSLRVDLRCALRSLVTGRGFSLAALSTLTVGIGAATAIFSIVNGILLRPLPYPDAARVMWASETAPTGGTMTLAWPNYEDWRTRVRSLDPIATSSSLTYTLTGVGQATRVDGRQTTSSFFAVLATTPALGRLFTAADDTPGPVHPIVVSDSFWRHYLGGTRDAIGRHVTLDGEPHEVIGVLPSTFRYNLDYAIYEPLGVVTGTDMYKDRGNHQGLFVIGRLKPGVTEAAARAEIQAIAADLAREHPDTNTGIGATLQSLSSRIVGDLEPALVAVLVAVGLLLVIACVNVVNLTLARAVTRREELALRAALGCGRARLSRQLLLESAMLAVAGGVCGVGAGWALLRVLLAIAPVSLPRLDDVRLDLSVLLFAGAVIAVAALVVGILPAIHASRADGQSLVVRTRAGATRSQRLRSGLLVVEVALALILLAGAGLMARTMWQLSAVSLGFSADHLLTLRYTVQHPEWKSDRVLAFHDEMLTRARAIPGVTDAAITMSLPIEGSQWGSVFVVGDRPAPPRADILSAAFSPVSPTFFHTLRVPLQAGRTFTAADVTAAPRIAVVNASFAKRFWPDQSAIGKTLKQGWPEWNTPWRTIVGVVDDVKLNGVTSDTPMQVYLPVTQEPLRGVALVVRTAGNPADAIGPLNAIAADLDRDMPIYRVQTMNEWLGDGVARERLSMVILAVFGGIAIVLASVGLYGVASQAVNERTREISVRLALGASRPQVARLFLRQGLATTAAGIVVGVAAAMILARFLESLLFHVKPGDPLTLAASAFVLFVVAFAACYFPARRAMRVSLTDALRT